MVDIVSSTDDTNASLSIDARLRRWTDRKGMQVVPVYYYYVDRSNVTSQTLPTGLDRMLKQYKMEARSVGIILNVFVYNYEEARDLITEVDPELGALYTEINLAYATTLSNMLRMAALWKFGGIYHDLKCSLNSKQLIVVLDALKKYDLVFEERPGTFGGGARRIRATNMAATRPGLEYFRSCLVTMRKKLLTIKEKHARAIAATDAIDPKTMNANRHMIYDVGSHSMLDRIAAHTHLHHSGHITIGYHCLPKEIMQRGHENCTNDPITGTLPRDESFVIFLWNVRFDTAILESYNQGSSQHWSHISKPLFPSLVAVTVH